MIFDSHLHIIDPRFPLVPNQGFVPDAFTCRDYLAVAGALGISGGAVVSGSFQAFDQTYLLDALPVLGPSFVGVAQLPVETTEDQISRLHLAGVRAVRFNLVRGGPAAVDDVDTLAHKVFDTAGWHSEFYLRNADLPDLTPMLLLLPRVSIDHLGLTSRGLDSLLRLVEAGATVKATGFGRGDLDVPRLLRQIHDVNPAALMFGTDLPGTRARRPFRAADIALVQSALGPSASAKVLCDNAVAVYGPKASPTDPASAGSGSDDGVGRNGPS
jgi:predicted TIM-barrel fold metal-dependent hydrolase